MSLDSRWSRPSPRRRNLRSPYLPYFATNYSLKMSPRPPTEAARPASPRIRAARAPIAARRPRHPATATRSPFPERLGRRPFRRWAQAVAGASEHAAPRATEAYRASPRARDAPLGISTASQPARLPHRVLRHPRSDPAKSRAVSRRALLRSVGSRAPRRRSERRASFVLRHPQHRDSHRSLRQRARDAARSILGGPLARSRAHVAAGGAKRARLRAREFSKTRECATCSGHRRVFVRGLVRRLE